MRHVLTIIFLAACISSSSSFAAERKEPRIDWSIKQAYRDFKKTGSAEAIKLADERLRLYVLRNRKQEEVREQRGLLVSHNYAPAFVERYDASVKWRRHLDTDDGRAAYSLATDYDQRQGSKLSKYIVEYLIRLAVQKDYPPALKKQAAEFLISEDAEKRERGCNYLKTLGEKGDVEAALQLARMYMNGKVLQQDNVRALFWLFKALKSRMESSMPNWQGTLYELQPDGRFTPKKGSEEKLAQMANNVSPHLLDRIEEVRQRTSPKDRLNVYLSLRSDDIPIGCLIKRGD